MLHACNQRADQNCTEGFSAGIEKHNALMGYATLLGQIRKRKAFDSSSDDGFVFRNRGGWAASYLGAYNKRVGPQT